MHAQALLGSALTSVPAGVMATASCHHDPREERHLGHRLYGQIEWETLTPC